MLDEKQIDELVIETINKNSLAGMAVGVNAKDRVVYAKGFGIADAARGALITPSTHFRVGSISKTLTALGLMQLCERGKFNLDDPITQYRTSYRIEQPPGSAPITFRHLMTHTAGIGELRRLSDVVRPVLGLACKPGRLPALKDYYRDGLRADCAPGTKWSYANHGFATLGQFVEDISGQPFRDYMRENVLRPLGMTHSDFYMTDEIRGSLAAGYRMRRKGLKAIPYLEIIPGPAGSLFSSLEDMLKYAAALQNGGAPVVAPETLATMLSPHYQPDPRMPAMGLAFMLDSLAGHRVAGHNGGWPGFTSAMWFMPNDRVGVVALTNTSTIIAPHMLASSILSNWFRDGEHPYQDNHTPLIEQPALWPELCGTYRPVPGWNTNARLWMLGGAARIFVKDGKLRIGTRLRFGAIGRGLELHSADKDDPLMFKAAWDGLKMPVLFKRDEAGRIRTVCIAMSAGVWATLHKR